MKFTGRLGSSQVYISSLICAKEVIICWDMNFCCYFVNFGDSWV